MDSSFIRKYLESQTPKLYSFAYALIPDDLQAQQIVLDAHSLLFLKEQDLEESEDSILFTLLCHIYKLGLKRLGQLEGSLSFRENSPQFYQLSIAQRGVLFLSHQLELDSNKMAIILGVSVAHISQLLHTARAKFLDSLGMGEALESIVS